MALNLVRGRGKRGSPVAPAPLPIGDIDGDIFNCPVCSRPLAPGSRRCQGCGTRLLIGVPVAKASVFVAAGLAFGVLLGGGVVGISGLVGRPSSGGLPAAPDASKAPQASLPPGTSPRPSAVATYVPAMTRSALGQAVSLHLRLGAAGDELASLVKAKRISTAAIQRVLRSIANDTAHGATLPDQIARWDDASLLAAELRAYYDQLRGSARDALRLSVANRSGYKAAGQEIVAMLRQLPALDERTRALASLAGAPLPPGS